MKQYEIIVPEQDRIREEYFNELRKSQILPAEDLVVTPSCEYFILRRAIHMLIREKAIELGWDRYDDSRNNAPYIYLWPDGSGSGWLQEYNNERGVPEITWEDFLNLTPDDVSDTDVVEMPSAGTERNENTLSDLIRLMAKSARDAGYAKGLLSGFILCFDENLNVRDNEMLKLCVKNANEFINKAGDE